MAKERKSRTFNPRYESPKQGYLAGFEHPFERELDETNRWVVLSKLIPWDEICNIYLNKMGKKGVGRRPINPRIVFGSLIIMYMCGLDDRETIDQISENIYMQYFLGYPSFTSEKPFDASLFVEIRKRLSMDTINAINEKIVCLKTRFEAASNKKKELCVKSVTVEKEEALPVCSVKEDIPSGTEGNRSDESKENVSPSDVCLPPAGETASTGNTETASTGKPSETSSTDKPSEIHKGRLLIDATVCPQNIAYPTDPDLLSDAREKSEQLIDRIYDIALHGEKPRTDRTKARKEYLRVAQNKKKTKKKIRNAIRKQLGYLQRNIRSINRLLDAYPKLPFDKYERKYFYVIQTVLEQQLMMYRTHTHTIESRIVSIHQPHVRPIVRGKQSVPVEFGPKIQVSTIDGISFLDELGWEAYNEGGLLQTSVEKYRLRFGCYPKEVLADQIYCTRANRKMLKEMGIILYAKPLGRPSSASALSIHVRPGERNPIEGKFGQAKTGYGMDCIKARLKATSESWIAGIILVLNLVKPAGVNTPCFILNVSRSFSVRLCEMKDYLYGMYSGDIHRSLFPAMIAA